MIENFASITLEQDRGIPQKTSGAFSSFLEEAKKKKVGENLKRYMHDIIHFWYYQYIDAFHLRAKTVDDLFMGLRYLYMKQEVKDGR